MNRVIDHHDLDGAVIDGPTLIGFVVDEPFLVAALSPARALLRLFPDRNGARTATLPKLEATPAQRAAHTARLGGSPRDGANVRSKSTDAQTTANAATSQIACTARRSHDRAAQDEQHLIRRKIRERAHAMRVELVARFPKCFQTFGAPKQPLAIGIFEMVTAAAPDLDRHDVINVVADYTSGSTYHRAMIADATRVDLDGNPVGVVTAGAAGHAAKMLAKINMRPKPCPKRTTPPPTST